MKNLRIDLVGDDIRVAQSLAEYEIGHSYLDAHEVEQLIWEAGEQLIGARYVTTEQGSINDFFVLRQPPKVADLLNSAPPEIAIAIGERDSPVTQMEIYAKLVKETYADIPKEYPGKIIWYERFGSGPDQVILPKMTLMDKIRWLSVGAAIGALVVIPLIYMVMKR